MERLFRVEVAVTRVFYVHARTAGNATATALAMSEDGAAYMYEPVATAEVFADTELAAA